MLFKSTVHIKMKHSVSKNDFVLSQNIKYSCSAQFIKDA